jgi:hypothetical protein
VVGADSYANLYAQLMSWDECVPLAEQFCGQAGIPSDPKELTAHYRAALGDIAAVVDAGFPHNTDLSFEDGRPVLRRRKGADRRPSALALEEAIHQRLPARRPASIRGSSRAGLRRSRVASDLCSSEADFDKIKTVRANAMPWEGRRRPATVRNRRPSSVPALALPIETR